jgi:hypothetical protein
MMDKDILAFVFHKSNCDHLQPMWHQGLCDCGLYALLSSLRSIGLSTDARNGTALFTLYMLMKVCPELMADWEVYIKTKMPDSIYRCRKCEHPTAEKQQDIQGWDGFCHNCGMIAQEQVGGLAFSNR